MYEWLIRNKKQKTVSLAIREMPIKTIMIYHYIHTRMIIIKKIADTKFL